MNREPLLLLIAMGLAILGLIIALEVAVWQECREHNSFLYCFKVLS